MKSAHRLKVSATINAGVLTLGAAYEDCFTLAQAIAAGDVAVGDTIALSVKDGAGHFEDSYWSVNSTTQATRQRIFRSSASGAAPAYTGTLTVYHDVFSEQHAGGLVDPDDVGYDLIICAGQSKMCGRGAADTLIDVLDPRIFQWGGLTGNARYQTIFSGQEPLHWPEGLSNGGGTLFTSPANAFARAYLATVPANRRVLLVPVAFGGTSLVGGTPRWAVGGDLRENAVAQANAALAAAQAVYPKSRIAVILYDQCESDMSTGVNGSQYGTALSALIADFRTRMTGAANALFIVGGAIPEYIASYGSGPGIDAAQKSVVASTARCAFVAAPGGYTTDNTHLTAPGSRISGTKWALSLRAARLNAGVDTIVPTALSAAVANANPTFVDITMSEAMDTAYTPAASSVTVSGHVVSALAWVSNTVLRATVSAPFVYGEAARTISYTQPGANNARDLAGNLLANITSAAITNNVQPADTTAPSVASAVIANGSPSDIVITFSETLAAFTPAAAAFVASGGRTISSVARAGATLTLTVDTPYTNGDVVTIGYTKPGSNPIQDAAGNQTNSFTGQTVTNNIAAADTTAPAFVSAQVANAAPNVIVLTMSEALAASIPPTSAFSVSGGKTVNGVSVSGATVSLTVSAPYANGDTVTVTYSQPSGNPRIQDAAGNPTTSFGPVSVTNNVAPPAAPTLTGMSAMQATATPNVYQGTTAGFWGAGSGGGKLTAAFQSGVDGEFVVQMMDAPNHVNSSVGREIGIGVDATQLGTGLVGSYTTLDYAMLHRGDGCQGYANGATATDTTGIIAAQNDYVRVKRVGSTLTVAVSHDAGATWLTVKTWAGAPTGVLYCYVQLIFTTSVKLVSATGLA